MRAATLVRTTLVLMFVASIGVAGTTVVLHTASTFFAQADLFAAADELDIEPVQADQLERQLRSYQVRLAADGSFNGRVNIMDPVTGGVTTAQEMTIAFLQNGNVMYEVHPGLEGRFQIANVIPGTYSVVGAGPDGYVAYALSVLPAELTVEKHTTDDGLEAVAAFQEVQEELAIDSVAIPVSDLPTVLSLAENNIPSELLQPNASGTGVNPAEPVTAQYDAQALPRKDVALTGHQVRIQADGTLEGRVHRINQNGEPTRIRRLNVFLVQNNQVISQAPVDELGSFNFFDVEEGVYSFVAAGVEGLAAFTMQAVSGPDLAGVSEELILPVSTAAGMVASGTGGVVGGDDVNQAYERGQDAQNGGDGSGGGQGGNQGTSQGTGESGGNGGGSGTTGSSEGTAGGGGGGTGGTGLGEALLAAGVIAAAVAASQNGGGQNGGSQTMSPMDPGGQTGAGQTGSGQ